MRLFPPVWVPCDETPHPTLQNYFPRRFQLAKSSILGFFPSDFKEVYLGTNQYGEGFLLIGDPDGEEKKYRGIFLQELSSNDSHRDRVEWVQKAVCLFKECAGMDPAEILEVSARRVPADMMPTIERMPYFVNRYLGVLPCEMDESDKAGLEQIVSRRI